MAILLMYCILLAFMQSGSQAFNNFTVGGENNWEVPNDTNAEIYNQWAGRNRFKVGDSLVFVYNSNEDSVLQVTHQKYVSCNTSDPINKFQDGYTVFKLNQPGSFYFISGANGHCQKSQKLHVVVMAIRGVTPPSSPPQFPPVPAPAPVVPAHVPAPAPAPLIMMETPAPSPAPSMVPAVPPTSTGVPAAPVLKSAGFMCGLLISVCVFIL